MISNEISVESENRIFNLIERLDVRGPRYTSYPTAPVWSDEFPVEPFKASIEKTGKRGIPVALYVHIPYCHRRCLYCGCNSVVTNNQDRMTRYKDALVAEIESVSSLVGGKLEHSWLHFGGGTPTHIPVDDLAEIIDHLLDRFPGISEAERSIEVDPRVTSVDYLRMLREKGFRRISIGLQDFDPNVQKAVQRQYSFEQMQDFVELCRSNGFTSVNIDLIYGLPLQTRETWEVTLDQVRRLIPERLACFGYAHLPGKIKHQRAIVSGHLPSPRDRLGMLLDAQRFFTDNGYDAIGLDHFALPDDKLAIARREGRLWRNFMGYTDIYGLEMIGFGASAISEFDELFAQNITAPDSYIERVENGELPLVRCHQLDEDDRTRKRIINNLMCNLIVELPDDLPTEDADLRESLSSALDEAGGYESLGLVKPNGRGGFEVTQVGQLFLRNIAMHFDRYLADQSQVGFSRTV